MEAHVTLLFLDNTSDVLFFLSALPSVVSGAVRVKAPLGGIASVHCSYQKGNENNPKYFRKGKFKTLLARLDSSGMWVQDSRFYLQDDKEKTEFIVTVRNLSVEDAGLYWCGVDKWLWDFVTEVNLDVVQETLSTTASGVCVSLNVKPCVKRLL